MKFLTTTFFFLMMSYLCMADCLTTVTGPTSICSPVPSTAVYSVNLTGTGWLCGNIMSLQLSPNSGMMTSIVDADGNELLSSPTNSFIRTRLSYPLAVTVNWTSNGCHKIGALGGDASGFLWCGCKSSADLDVLVGPPAPATNITLSGGEPANSCGNITLCASGNNTPCIDGFIWTIKGETITTSTRCLTYFLETCPLGPVTVAKTSGCGTTGKFEKSFSCDGGSNNPYIDFEFFACKGRYWSATIPGSNIKIEILNDSGNTIGRNGNTIYFTPTELGPVVITVTFTVCGTEFTQTIFLQVVDCGPIINLKGDDPIQSREEQKPETDFTSIEAEIYPNPATDILNIQTENSNYTARVYNLQGQLLNEINNLEKNAQIDVSKLPVGAYFVTIEVDGKIITKKMTKQ